MVAKTNTFKKLLKVSLESIQNHLHANVVVVRVDLVVETKQAAVRVDVIEVHGNVISIDVRFTARTEKMGASVQTEDVNPNVVGSELRCRLALALAVNAIDRQRVRDRPRVDVFPGKMFQHDSRLGFRVKSFSAVADCLFQGVLGFSLRHVSFELLLLLLSSIKDCSSLPLRLFNL
jgi:hypothetical protein